jgi:uncharacterized protein YijF (DUF1287 family)
VSVHAFFMACVLAAGVARADATDVVLAARQQVGVTVHYDPAYRTLAYPNGDLPPERGVCTDVVIRALRAARRIDLQAAVHEDIRAHAAAYPLRRWRASRPDASIDHRRVPNLMVYFARQGYARPAGAAAADYLPGDIVAWDLGRGILHVGIVTDRKAVTGAPLVVHNIGAGAREEDILFRFAVIGHYRLPPR